VNASGHEIVRVEEARKHFVHVLGSIVILVHFLYLSACLVHSDRCSNRLTHCISVMPIACPSGNAWLGLRLDPFDTEMLPIDRCISIVSYSACKLYMEHLVCVCIHRASGVCVYIEHLVCVCTEYMNHSASCMGFLEHVWTHPHMFQITHT
jgi:hypothetical protein